jgi:hypothetical protein
VAEKGNLMVAFFYGSILDFQLKFNPFSAAQNPSVNSE